MDNIWTSNGEQMDNNKGRVESDYCQGRVNIIQCNSLPVIKFQFSNH